MRITSVVLLLALCAARSIPADAAEGDFLIVPAKVWTGDGDAAKAGWAVRVHDGAIAAVGPLASLQATPEVIRIDLPGATLTPVLIDLHSHLFLHPYNETPWNDQVLKEPQDYRTLLAAEHARVTLLGVSPRCGTLAPKGLLMPTCPSSARSMKA